MPDLKYGLNYEDLPSDASTQRRLETGLNLASLGFVIAWRMPLGARNIASPTDEYLDRYNDQVLELVFVADAVARITNQAETTEASRAWVLPAKQGLQRIGRYMDVRGFEKSGLFSDQNPEVQREAYSDMCERRTFRGWIDLSDNKNYADLVSNGNITLELGTLSSKN